MADPDQARFRLDRPYMRTSKHMPLQVLKDYIAGQTQTENAMVTVMCHDRPLLSDITLDAVRQTHWCQSDDLVLSYRITRSGFSADVL